MSLEALNRTLFHALDATGARPGAVLALEVLAQAPVWLLPVLILGIWLAGDRHSRAIAIKAGLAGCVAMAAAHFASMLVDHPRPFMIGLAPNVLDHSNDSSFPSDHTTLFFALAASFRRRAPPYLTGLSWLLAGLGLAVGLARVALGVHFPLDVLGAIVIGVGSALATDLGLGWLCETLFTFGEALRGLVGSLATRDVRKRAD